MNTQIITEELKKNGFSINTLLQFENKCCGQLPTCTNSTFLIVVVFEEVSIKVNGIPYKIAPNSVIYVNQGTHIDYPGAVKSGSRIYVITFCHSFFVKSSEDSFLLNSQLFLQDETHICISPFAGTEQDFKQQFLDRLAIYQAKNNGLYNAVAHTYIKILLLEGLFHLQNSSDEREKDFSSLGIINRFKVLLQQQFKVHKHVTYYAKELFVSPRKLSEMAEGVLGRTAKQVIMDKVSQEAVLLLKNSDLTISEISYELGFTDEGNFTNFIKKNTGKTPKMIRLSLLNAASGTQAPV